jgi:hypothetical protein
VVDQPQQPAEDLPDDCVLVRGGRMEVRDLIVSACGCHDRHGYFGWSFWGRPGASADEIAEDAQFPHPNMRESTVGRLRGAGFEPQIDHLEPDDDHIQVRLDREPDEPLCERLRAAFDPIRRRTEV